MQQVPQVTQIPLQRFTYVPKFQPAQNFQKQNNLAFPAHRQQFQPTQNVEFDGKRLRKAVTRKTVDYNSSVINYVEVSINLIIRHEHCGLYYALILYFLLVFLLFFHYTDLYVFSKQLNFILSLFYTAITVFFTMLLSMKINNLESYNIIFFINNL